MTRDELKREIETNHDRLIAASSMEDAEKIARETLALLPQLEQLGAAFREEKDRDALWEAMRLATRVITPEGPDREHKERLIALKYLANEANACCSVEPDGRVTVPWKARHAARAFLVEAAKLDLARLDEADRDRAHGAIRMALAVAAGESFYVKR
jgi:hypothetical protein